MTQRLDAIQTVLCSYIAEDNAAVITLMAMCLLAGVLFGLCVGMSIRWTQVRCQNQE